MGKPTQQRLAVRLAIRTEGDFINAYVVETEDVTDALLIATVRKSLFDTDDDDAVWLQYKAVLSNLFVRALVSVLDEKGIPVDGLSMVEEKPTK